MATRAHRAPAALAAYVLHRYDWSESSLILDLFTREQGRVAVAAKGAKRPYSQLRACCCRSSASTSRSAAPADGEGAERGADTCAAPNGPAARAMLTGAALFSGFYLNELLMKLLARHDPHPRLFDAYAATLPALAGDECRARSGAARVRADAAARDRPAARPEPRHADAAAGAAATRATALLADAGVGAPRSGSAELPGAALIALQAALQHGSVAALQQACARGAARAEGRAARAASLSSRHRHAAHAAGDAATRRSLER